MNGNTFSELRNKSISVSFHCRDITVRRGRTIKFEFLQFDVPAYVNTECRSYVLFKNGASMESPFLGQGKYCGTSIPTVEKTSSNRAVVGEERI